MTVESGWPSVTCTVTAHNYAAFVEEAIGSVLMQDYPPDLLRVVVVNDGSTDATGAVLASAFGQEPRVEIIDQPNRGFIGATNAVLSAATGDLIAILDADDAWTPGRLRRQVEILRSRPEVGLVHGDMQLVDGDGRLLHPSYFQWSRFDVRRGRTLAQLMRGPNFVTASAIVFRARFLEEIYPIPPEAVYPDWYFATQIAQHAEIDHPDGVVSLYRMHGANMGLGRSERKFFEDMRQNVNVQRRMLRTLRLDSERVVDLIGVASKMRSDAHLAAEQLDVLPEEMIPVTPDDRAAAAAAAGVAQSLMARGAVADAARAWILAAAHDPWEERAAGRLADAERQLPSGGEIASRSQVLLGFADELIADPGMLRAYGALVAGEADVTLLLWAPEETDELVAALTSVVESCGMDGDHAADLLLYCSPDVADVLRARIIAVYTRTAPRSTLAHLPHVIDIEDAGLTSVSGHVCG